MEILELDTWEDFRAKADEFLRDAEASKEARAPLFRGQADANWALSTTLERATAKQMSLGRYYLRASSVRNEIEARTGIRWNIPDYLDYRAMLESGTASFPLPDDLYEYLCFLRHHGFPTPLLDWSASPYVAAYFAFAGAKPDSKVAIFAFLDSDAGFKVWMQGAARIQELGPHVTTHVRHFNQQSRYTVAFTDAKHHARYRAHEEVASSSSEHQDRLWKLILPGSIRTEALRYLGVHNVNAYSLYGSVESLMETLAVREFDLKPGKQEYLGDDAEGG